MNKIVFQLYLSAAAKPFKKVMRRACFCTFINHQQADPLCLLHLTKPSLPLTYITQNFRANPAEHYHLTGYSSYNPHRGACRLRCSVGRSRKAVSFIEFNP